MHTWYKFLTYLFYVFSPIYLLIRKLKNKEHPERYKEKLSIIKKTRKKGFLIWFHAASVGEISSIFPLIENLEKNEKIQQILITSITVSSSYILEKKFSNSNKIVHQFLPFDVPNLVKKFLNHWSPNLSIFIESEIWPNLICQIKKKNISLLLVNARLTKKSYTKWKFIINYSKKIFGKFDLCIAANKDTEARLKYLGAKNIKNYGSIKFSKTKNNYTDSLDSVFLENAKNRKIWSAGSTHAKEEIFCAKTHIKLKKSYNNILTIIIPRHIDRVEKIKKDLSKLNLNVILFSNLNQMNSKVDVLLIDAYGETSKFYNISKCVFLGGSIINRGGQNPIEAARFGCKVFHGPNVGNFHEIYEYLKILKVAKQVNNTKELDQSIVEEFSSTQFNKNEIVQKLDNYGLNILNNVIKEIKIYIDT